MGYFFFFFLSPCICYFKGQSLRCSPALGNAGHWAVMLYVGEGLRGSNGARSTLCQISVTPSATHNQIGPLWCWFPSGGACERSRPPWVSPTPAPVRLRVSPAAASTSMGVFNQRFEALFPHAGALGCTVCFAPPPFLQVYLSTNVGPWGLLEVALPALFVPQSAKSLGLVLPVYLCGCKCGATGSTTPFIPHSTSLWVPLWQGESSPPIFAPPMGLDECFFFYLLGCRTSLLFDFLSVLVVRGGVVCLPMPPSWFS